MGNLWEALSHYWGFCGDIINLHGILFNFVGNKCHFLKMYNVPVAFEDVEVLSHYVSVGVECLRYRVEEGLSLKMISCLPVIPIQSLC